MATTDNQVNIQSQPEYTLSGYDKQYLSAQEQAQIEAYKKAYAEAQAAGDTAGMASAHSAAEAIRSQYKYSGGGDGSDFIPWGGPLGGSSSAGSTGSGAQTPNVPALNPTIPSVNVDKIGYVDTSKLEQQLADMAAAQREQVQKATDYAVQQGINELQRTEEDAKAQFQTQRNQVAADEMAALDNQALYAEARGDRGGIGAAQYAEIQNTAAQNRLAVNREQTKLSTDVARQISDLRAQGEFEKADKLLEISQTYLQQLVQLEQWALEANLSVDQFNAQLQQWEAEYRLAAQQYLSDLELAKAQLTGSFSDGTQTLESQKYYYDSLASSGEALLAMGIMPNAEQLRALGMSASQAQAYLNALALQAAAEAAGSGGGGGGSYKEEEPVYTIDDLFAAAQASGSPQSFLISKAKEYGFTYDSNDVLYDDYLAWLDRNDMTEEKPLPGSSNRLPSWLEDNLFLPAIDIMESIGAFGKK